MQDFMKPGYKFVVFCRWCGTPSTFTRDEPRPGVFCSDTCHEEFRTAQVKQMRAQMAQAHNRRVK